MGTTTECGRTSAQRHGRGSRSRAPVAAAEHARAPVAPGQERQVHLENVVVEALQCGGDRAPELLDERIHGALLVGVRVRSNHHPVRAPFFNPASVTSGDYVTPP